MPSVTLSCRWEAGVSHLVLPKLVRNVQVLAALASGAWLVSWSFLTACQHSHTWEDPVSVPLCTLVCYCRESHTGQGMNVGGHLLTHIDMSWGVRRGE